MSELPHAECSFEPGSVVDPVGRVFKYQGRIFRAIAGPYTDIIVEALTLAEANHWFEQGLIPTWRTDYSLAGYSLVIEHQRVPFVTLRGEWSGAGLKEAALCYLRVAAALARAQLCLKDAHTWNVLFDHTIPYVIDWGSIRPLAELNWEFWYFQFRKYFLVPLYLFSLGQAHLARAMLREHQVGVGNFIIDLPMTRRVPEEPFLIFQKYSPAPSAQAFEDLMEYVARLALPRVEGEWIAYEQPRFNGLADLENIREKDRIVQRLVSSDPCSTVLDMGCNHGLHSEICAELGKRVVAADIEETCINELFVRTKQSKRSILPLYVDMLWPIGDSGFMNTIASAHHRLACDTCLAMALVHHLAFKHFASFESIARSISRFTWHRAIVEFVPREDWHVAQWAPERLPWYSAENFIAAMLEYFTHYTIIPSEPAPRQIMMFEGKKKQWISK